MLTENSILTCRFKWKPLEDLSVDFKLRLSVGATQSPLQRSIHLQHCKGGTAGSVTCHETFETIPLDTEEWTANQARLQSLDGAVVECAPAHTASKGNAPFYSETLTMGRWELRRVRHDKPNANYITVVEEIMQSIKLAMTAERLMDAVPRILLAWKLRHPESSVSSDSIEGSLASLQLNVASPTG